MTQELKIRLAFFIGIFIMIALWELLLPRRSYEVSKVKRWFNNLSIIVLNSAIIRFLVPVIPVALAAQASEKGWGLLNVLEMNPWVEFIIGLLLLDFIIYLQHLMFHATPLLWRLHMVHHVDLGIDVTTGLRFHPIEILVSIIIKIMAISVLGPSVLCVLAFEITLNGTAMFNHGNIYINPAIDRFLRLLVVTPDMHRVHHSVAIAETNSNFGFNFPWWDRIFGTYRAQSFKTHPEIIIGIAPYRKNVPLPQMLALPFYGDPGYYAINKWGRVPVKQINSLND